VSLRHHDSEWRVLQEAIAQYRAALSVAPGYAEAWCNLGVIHKNQVRVNSVP
jgi:TPR repeat